MAPAQTEEEFDRDRERTDDLLREAEEQESGAHDEQVALKVELKQLREQQADYASEIASLEKRTSNIDRRLIELRLRMCADVGVSESDLPFAGELLQVKASEVAGEGAIRARAAKLRDLIACA